MGLFQGWLVVSKRLDPGSSTLARDDTVYSLMGLFRAGWLFPKDWITAQTTPPDRYRSGEDPGRP